MTEQTDTALDQLLGELTFPCDRHALMRDAAAHGAGDELLGRLGALPEHEYRDAAAVRDACREHR